MANVTFTGTVSAQYQAGETVTITVTLPDSTTEDLTATTLADKTFSVTKEYAVAGDYSAVAHIPADAAYQEATSPIKAFTVGLATRDLTLDVSVA